ncbi:MAG: glycosyltransferase family 39 protein [Candidatus Altiarchaeota archaeon]
MRIDYRILLVILLALSLRLVNLSSVPKWDPDENANVNYAVNLMAGTPRLFAYKYHFIPHPPAYFLSLILPIKLLGPGMLAIRIFSVVMSLIGMIIVYAIVSRILGAGYGFLAGLLYALTPELVFWGRMGFANNCLSVLVLASIYFLQNFLESGRERDLALSSILVGAATLVEYSGLVFVFSIALVLFWNSRKHLFKSLFLSLAPLIIFVSLMLLFDSNGFLRDFQKFSRLYLLVVLGSPILLLVLSRFSGRLLEYVDSLYAGNSGVRAEFVLFIPLILYSLMPVDHKMILSGVFSSFFIMSLMGLFVISNDNLRRIVFVYLHSYLLFLLMVNRADHMLIPVVYILSITPVFFLKRVINHLAAVHPRRVVVLTAIPFIFTFWCGVEAFVFCQASMTPVQEVMMMNDFIDQRVVEGDFVAFTMITPDTKADEVSFRQIFSYYGLNLIPYDRYLVGTSPSDFTRNLSVENIDYAVFPVWVLNDLNGTEFSPLLDTVSNWSMVYEIESSQQRPPGLRTSFMDYLGFPTSNHVHYVVFENPERI